MIQYLYIHPTPGGDNQLFILKAGFICGNGPDPHYSREISLNRIVKYAVRFQITYCILERIRVLIYTFGEFLLYKNCFPVSTYTSTNVHVPWLIRPVICTWRFRYNRTHMRGLSSNLLITIILLKGLVALSQDNTVIPHVNCM